MTEQKHTPEPWRIGAMESGQVAIDAANGSEVTGWLDSDDARRIVACVNACAGLDTDALEKLPDISKVAAARRKYIAEIEQQRDQLRAALDKLYNAMDSCVDLTPEVMWQARAALAATEGV